MVASDLFFILVGMVGIWLRFDSSKNLINWQFVQATARLDIVQLRPLVGGEGAVGGIDCVLPFIPRGLERAGVERNGAGELAVRHDGLRLKVI